MLKLLRLFMPITLLMVYNCINTMEVVTDDVLSELKRPPEESVYTQAKQEILFWVSARRKSDEIKTRTNETKKISIKLTSKKFHLDTIEEEGNQNQRK